MRIVFDTGAFIALLGDALVMAGASIEGDVVYTSDLDDFLRLTRSFLP
jgi:hypothetical protein